MDTENFALDLRVFVGVNYLAAKLTRHQKNNHMTELNLFLRFIAPANAGCSAYSKASSIPEFLNPKERILFAAFLSLSCVVLQFSQVHSDRKSTRLNSSHLGIS